MIGQTHMGERRADATRPGRAWRMAGHRAVAGLVAVVLALCLAASGTPAQAGANLVVNGTFTQNSLSPSGSGYTSFELGTWTYNSTSYTGTVNGWTNASGAYNYLFTSGTATALGSYGTLLLQDGSAMSPVPGGGNFLANDGDFDSGTVSQTITGLTVGAKAVLTFWWAAGVQNGFTLPNTENWDVCLNTSGTCTSSTAGMQSTPQYTLTTVAFSGWMEETLTFIPTSTTEVLSFLAVGTGQPPFLLLTDVSLTMPEPGTLAVMLSGLFGLAIVVRRRRRSARQTDSIA